MPFFERPNLKRSMIEAQCREREILEAQKDKPNLSKYEKKVAKQAKWERRAAESNYYSRSGLGPAPWQQEFSRWAVLVFVIGLAVIVAISMS